MEETISENELVDAQLELEPKHAYPTAVELSTGHFRTVSNTPFSAKNSPTASKAVVSPRPRRVSVLHKVISNMIKRKKRGVSKTKFGAAVAQQNTIERAIAIIDKNTSPDPDQKKGTKDKKSSKAKSSKKNKSLKFSEDKEVIAEGTSKSNRSKTNIIDHYTKANPLQLKALEKIRFIQELTIPTVADDAISTSSAASAAWGDAFSIKTQGTDYSSVSADDISIRTEDIIDKDGTVHNYNYPEIVDESAKEDEDEENNEPRRDEFEIDFQIDPTPIGTSKRKKSIEKNENWTIEDHNQPNEEWEEVVEHETDPNAAKAGSSRHKQQQQTTAFKNIITKYTYKKFRWNHEYTSLTVKSCVYPITAEQLAQSKGSLVSLKFAQLTSFKNILNFLQNCPNLKKLSFSNIALVQKKSVIDSKITLPHVKELEMTEWLMCLTKNEYWLLDYFTQKVNFRKLQSFTFRGTENFVSEKNRRKCTLTLKKITQVSAVAKFLFKNRDTLKKVSLGGVGFKIMEGGETTDLSTMHSLQHLRVPLNVSGVDVLLKSQSRLSSLAGCGYINLFTDQMRDMIHNCISKNSNTLRAVGIFPCILLSDHPSSVVDRNIIYSFDCEILRNCKKLESLFLNTTLSSRTVTVRNSCGHIFNLQALPLTLVQIEIYNYEFQEVDLDNFGKRFLKFVKLKKLILSSDKSRTYSIQLAWLKSLFSLQKFSSADFFGGKMGSPQAFQNFVLSKPKGYMTMVKIADCVSFYKNSQNE